MACWREFSGEFLGTFLMVLFGCGAVGNSVLFGSSDGIFQIAVVWGIVITLGIYMTRNLSCAHFNPAVSIAMAASGRMKKRKLPLYLLGQFAGAFCAALLLYLVLSPDIAAYEAAHGIIRGTYASVATAKMFGEYYAQPGSAYSINLITACTAELIGTFVLVLSIFSLTESCNLGKPTEALAPVFIGLTVTADICLIGPLTQAGLNPARDFAPRMVALIFGWGRYAFPDNVGGFFWVYMLSPVLGGLIAALVFTKVLEPLMKVQTSCCC
jgi:glycerol uptake facilitator protein